MISTLACLFIAVTHTPGVCLSLVGLQYPQAADVFEIALVMSRAYSSLAMIPVAVSPLVCGASISTALSGARNASRDHEIIVHMLAPIWNCCTGCGGAVDGKAHAPLEKAELVSSAKFKAIGLTC